MEKNSNYEGILIGPLKVPLISLWENRHNMSCRESDVEVIVNPETFEIPDKKVMAYMEENVEIERKKAKSMGKSFFDGPKVRLTGYEVREEPGFDEIGDYLKIVLNVQPTSFFAHKFTNLSLDNECVWQMVRNGDEKDSKPKYGLANIMGNGAVVLSNDGFTIVEERGNIMQYSGPNMFGTPSEFTDYKKDGYNTFNTVRRMLKEQINISSEKIKDLSLLEIDLAGDDFHPEFGYLVKTDCSKDEFVDAPVPSKLYARQFVEFTPEALAPYLAMTIQDVPIGVVKRGNVWIPGFSPSWVPAQFKAMYKALTKEYGGERVEKAISDAFIVR